MQTYRNKFAVHRISLCSVEDLLGAFVQKLDLCRAVPVASLASKLSRCL